MTPSNNDLVNLVKNGDQQAFTDLTVEFDGMLRGLVASCDVDAEEKNDLYQEALIALYKAALSYKPSLEASFTTFARICIKHSIISALRIYYGKKNFPIRSSLSLNSEDDESVEIRSLGQATEPERLLIEKESYKALLNRIDNSLSQLENDVLKLYIQGKSYGEISNRLKMSTKSVDNAIQRIRGKLKLLIRT